MSARKLIARDRLSSTEVGVYRMEVQAMLAWNEREGLVQILAQLLERARLAGVVAGGLNTTTAKGTTFALKSPNIIALPTVQRNGN